ncbi:hypothetical protein [Paenibacillus herberti]|uniref:hypothetical protein n=1 Tax=Paenibacillus herberti TaxID=1619309 RepID=UPI001595C272|nr:hypothetical protein [Paenibacillus herberti]
MDNKHQEKNERPPVKVLDVRQVLEQLGIDPTTAMKEIFGEQSLPIEVQDEHNSPKRT